MIKIGSDCLNEGRKVIANYTQKEIYENIKNESKDEIKKLEMNIILEKEKNYDTTSNIFNCC